MNIEDEVYFSPNFTFGELDFKNDKFLIKQFKDRIKGFYLDPVGLLNEYEKAFAAGVLLFTAIDAIAYYSIGGRDRIKDLVYQIEEVKTYDQYIQNGIAQKVHEDFRNGLIHNGMIKNRGQFSYKISQIFYEKNGVLIINPDLLLREIRHYFVNYIFCLINYKDAYHKFRDKIKTQFKAETEHLA